MIRRIFQRSFSQTTFQRQIIQENGKLHLNMSFLFFMNIVDVTSSKKESSIPTVIDDPLQHDDYFSVRSMVTLEDLFK
jgi:hypothetical protein